MNTVKIINPAAGKGKAVREINDDCKYYVSKGIGDVEAFVKRTLIKEPETHFIICGGDGTINEAVNGVMASGASETAVLSAIGDGTGNDFIKYDPEVNGPVRCDVIRYNDRYFINILNIGFDCTVVERTAQYKTKPLVNGSFAYILGVLNTLSGDLGVRMNVRSVDENGIEEEFDDDLMLCVAANARYYGGGFMPAPKADVTDGLVDMLLVKKVPKTRIPSIIGKYKKGEHFDGETGEIIDKFKDIMIYRKCREIKISGMKNICADGEIEHCGEVNVSVVPKAVNFIFRK